MTNARPKTTIVLAGVLVALIGVALVVVDRAPRSMARAVPSPSSSEVVALSPSGDDAGPLEDEDRDYSFRLPSGKPAELSCDETRRVIAQVRTGLAYEPDPVAPRALATGTADWLDPHGLWSAAPDAPIQAAIEAHGADLVSEMEARVGDDCAAARAIGGSLVKWVDELRARFDHARVSSREADAAGAIEEIPFDAIAYSRPARQFADDLGARVGAFERAYGPKMKPFAEAARERFFPSMNADEWSRALLAAAVRAYVPLVDPHGAWAPLDEEESVYEVDLASHPPARLWDKSERTAIGVHLDGRTSAPLEPGDLVLSIAGVVTAGLPLEQLDQLSYAAADATETPTATILREGEHAPRTIDLEAPEPAANDTEDEDERLPVDRVAYGEGDALVVAIHDVRDDLGDLLARTILHERGGARDGRRLEGVVIDLRGNGGGSTDGAIAALGLFLPGAPLFPMKRRDGTIETDRAPEPPADDRWNGPVATLIDGETASAAEMIAGALAVYHRATTLGEPTYGKGCAQEYLDDDAHAGVLRLTTLLYALPDGAPVQRVGLAPMIAVSLVPLDDTEREATLAHAAPSWRGPDVRDRRISQAEEAWAPHGGAIGPCKDADLCKALRALGGTAAKSVRSTRGGGRR